MPDPVGTGIAVTLTRYGADEGKQAIKNAYTKYKSFPPMARATHAAIDRGEAARKTGERYRREFEDEYNSDSLKSDEGHDQDARKSLTRLSDVANRRFPENAGRRRRVGYALKPGSFVERDGPKAIVDEASDIAHERTTWAEGHKIRAKARGKLAQKQSGQVAITFGGPLRPERVPGFRNRDSGYYESKQDEEGHYAMQPTFIYIQRQF